MLEQPYTEHRIRTSTSGGPRFSSRATQCGRGDSRRRTPRRFGTNSKSAPSPSSAVQSVRTTRWSSARRVLTARRFNGGSSAGSVATKAAQRSCTVPNADSQQGSAPGRWLRRQNDFIHYRTNFISIHARTEATATTATQRSVYQPNGVGSTGVAPAPIACHVP